MQRFDEIKQQHLALAATLGLSDHELNQSPSLKDLFTEVEWLLHDDPVRHFDYYYDQIVCVGELLSTAIVAHFLNSTGLHCSWIDVRDVFRTDNNFRDAQIDWVVTEKKISDTVLPLFNSTDIVLTQGFIGATDENESTTLGREGSDYSAAIFANLLPAESQTIWKDVQGVMNADPKSYPAAQWIAELNYREVVEMSYYGAQVIHPKTIKPLQNKNIPLYVRSFLNPDATGTCIHNNPVSLLPPIIVDKHHQVMMEFKSRDFSFIGEGPTARIYQMFEEIKFKPNLTQNTAISMLCLVDDQHEKVNALADLANNFFDVKISSSLELLTVRHYNDQILDELLSGKQIVLQQKTPETIQVVIQL